MSRLSLPCRLIILLLIPLAVLLAPVSAARCAPESPSLTTDPIAELLKALESSSLERLGYTVQVGAFANLDNAVRLDDALDARGVEAFYFRHDSGLFKVRFGNYKNRDAALAEALRLRQQGLINEFYIVAPQDYAIARYNRSQIGDLREELVRTAQRYIGVPYRWGGTDDADGFDCSGLTMVCYRLNGLNLPRVSNNQYSVGRPIPREELRLGDLVFFATRPGRTVSHVGLYIGEERFIHAPRTGQNVQVESLRNPYYAERFIGARSYF